MPVEDSGETVPSRTYGPLMFHSGRHATVVHYGLLSAFQVTARIEPDPSDPKMSELRQRTLLLGEPGAGDAAIHVLMVCAPHRRVLPVGVDEVVVSRQPDGPVLMRARERSHTGTEFVFDVDLLESDGTLVSTWRGLHLRAVADNAWQQPLPCGLIGPFLTRRIIDHQVAEDIELTTTDAVCLGVQELPSRRVSVSHTAGHVLVAVSTGPVGVDWEVGRRTNDVLGEHDSQLAEAIAAKAAEWRGVSARRVWSMREALAGLAVDSDLPMSIDEVSEDRIVLMTSGDVLVVSAVVPSDLAAEPVVVSVAVERTG